MENFLQSSRFQSDRFFHILGVGWFCEAREATIGPYGSRVRARLALLRLVDRHPMRR